jgi:hypothetical protein
MPRHAHRRAAAPEIDRLEERTVLSLVALPMPLSAAAVARGIGGFTVLLVSDDSASRTLLQSPKAAMTLNVQDGAITRTMRAPTAEALADLNRDGIPDLIARFRYRDIKGLPPGTVTVAASDGTTSEVGTFTIAAPTIHGLRRPR